MHDIAAAHQLVDPQFIRVADSRQFRLSSQLGRNFLQPRAAALILGTQSAVSKNKLKPIAKILGYAQTGVRPEIMGIGPVSAVQKLCKKLKLQINDFDVIESNEAFAAQACAVTKELKLDPKKVNPNGGAIALGHPVGATGAILTIKALSELKRTNTKLGLVTMCIGGGQGIAIGLEMV